MGRSDAASLRRRLERARQAATREAQFAELFGEPMPNISRDYPGGGTYDIPIAAESQNALAMGQEVRYQLTRQSGGDPMCLTLTQMDAVIAEAKRVYAAVIAAMEGGKAASSGVQPATRALEAK
jgi:hypothetical protein